MFQDTHVSGHACREEIRLIYALTKPQYAIPVHGEYRHLVRHSELALEMGIPKENVFVMEEGDVLELNKKAGKVTGKVPAQGILVDGLGIGDVGNIVLNDRRQLSQMADHCDCDFGKTRKQHFGRSGYRIPRFCLRERI